MSDSIGPTDTPISNLLSANPSAPKRQRLNTIFGPGSVDGQLITEMEVEKFTYLWSIKNFSAISSRSDSVWSPSFTGGGSGFSWKLHVELKDKNDGDEEYVSIGLYLKDKTVDGKPVTATEKIMARFQVCILDIEGNPFGSNDNEDTYYDFSLPNSRNWTREMHLWEDVKEANERLIANDTMKIFCSVSLQLRVSERVEKFVVSRLERINADELTKRRKCELAIDFQELLADSRFADVAISTSTRSFMAHKAILIARSSVFRAMLSAPMLDSNQSTIEILDFDEEAVKGMLEFIYTGEVKNIQEMPSDILQIAEKYDLKGLKEDAELVLASNLNAENAAETLVLAEIYCATTLRTKTMEFIKQNETRVKTSTSFQNLAHSHPNLIAEIYFAK